MAHGFAARVVVTLCAVAIVWPTLAADEPYKVVFHLENLEREAVGNVVVQVHPEWAPLGAQRFAELVEQHFFDDNRFFRAVCGFVAQFGISGDPKVTSAWHGKTIRDDSQIDHVANNRGRLSFYTDGKDDRSTQIVFNVKDNDFLDEKGYVPFAEVTDGMFFVDRIYNKYGGAGRAPDQSRLETEGNAYVDKEFPLLTRIKTVEIVKTVKIVETKNSRSFLRWLV
jgi:cyclophilin family peptidyl-prolyl cis-trans isomerase